MDITVYKENEVFVTIEAEMSICYELNEYFSFYALNYKFHPKFKAKYWDGKIRLFKLATRTLYVGLAHKLIEFAKRYDYTIAFDKSMNFTSGIEYDNSIVDTLLENCGLTKRDYQEDAIRYALKNKRCVLESPTGSGKSFIIYSIIKHIEKKTLVIVPSIGLVSQMRSDFINYDPKVEKHVETINETINKTPTKRILISTWQSIYKLPSEWFERFDVVIGDEVHGFKATSLISIMEKCVNVEWRFGATGTVSNKDSVVNVLTLEGLFGPVKKVASTRDLMDRNLLTNIKIKAIVLKYNKQDSIAVRKLSYHDEMDYLISHEKRNNFITRLALNQDKNTLVLFQYVEKHGKVLYDIMNKMNNGSKKIHFVSGQIDGAERERIRREVETGDNHIILASYGTYAQGINIRRLHNIVFATSYKSRIKNLQSIGRGLRLHDNKDKVILYDIVDDCSTKSKKNFSVKHFIERMAIYNEEKFDFKIHNINF